MSQRTGWARGSQLPPATQLGREGLQIAGGPSGRPQRVTDAQVAVHADAGEEKDTAVEVPIEEKADKLAEGSAKGPVVSGSIVVHEGGQ